jgi:hypothetical protein
MQVFAATRTASRFSALFAAPTTGCGGNESGDSGGTAGSGGSGADHETFVIGRHLWSVEDSRGLKGASLSAELANYLEAT